MCKCTIWRSLNAGNTFHVTYLEVTCREMLSCQVQLEGFSLPRLYPAGCFINAKCGARSLPSFWWPRAQSRLDTTIIGVQGESWGLKGLSAAGCLHLDRSVITKTLCSFSFLVGLLNQMLAAVLAAGFVLLVLYIYCYIICTVPYCLFFPFMFYLLHSSSQVAFSFPHLLFY